MLRFTHGLGVRRDDPCASHSLLRLGTGPSRPWLGRSPGRASTGHSSLSGSPTGHSSLSGSPTGHSSAAASRTGHSPLSGSPTGALSRLRPTCGEPVRAGKLPRALLLPRPHPGRLGVRIPGLATVSDKIARQGLGQVRAHGTAPGRTFQQVRSLGACTLDEACGGDGFKAWLVPDWYNESKYRRYGPER